MGRTAFWKRVEALEAAGLVRWRNGGAMSFFGTYSGLATALWATPALWELAEQHGVTPEGRKDDWRAAPGASTSLSTSSDAALVSCRPHNAVPVAIVPDEDKRHDVMQRELRALNDLLASVTIKGAGPKISLARRFVHSLDLHGRIYAGASSYQVMSETERLAITFDGEPAAEVDVKASSLTVLHGLAGCRALPNADLYTIPSIPRDTVKHWLVQTIGSGTSAWSRWGDAKEHKVPPRVIREAMLARYPFLADLIAFVPPDILSTLPEKDHQWAAGQFIVAQEARAIVGALGYCVAEGIPALPVHDSLVVPASRVHVAEAALVGAFSTLLEVTPRLEVARPAMA